MKLKHTGDEIPPCRTPFYIAKLRDSLLFISRELVPPWFISSSMVMVSARQPRRCIVSYNLLCLIESNAFFKSINHQYSSFFLCLCFCRSAMVSSTKICSYHDLLFWNPACSSDRILCSCISSLSLVSIM